ncbi:unnamed protein product, partial [Ixodes hexagonus]
LECNECHRTFSSRSNLGTHKRTIHSSKTFACDLCPRVSKSARRLHLHVMNVHQKTAADSVCEHCSKRFTTIRKLQHHMAVMHMGDGACLADGKNPFPLLTVYRCKQCPHVTFSQYRNKAHAITHTGVMPFACPQCDKTFVMRDVLNRHILLKHNEGKEKQCPHCKRRFISDSRYYSHVRFHEKNAGFVCDQCGQLFESKGFLEQHAQRHLSAEKTWSCHVCSHTFKVSTTWACAQSLWPTKYSRCDKNSHTLDPRKREGKCLPHVSTQTLRGADDRAHHSRRRNARRKHSPRLFLFHMHPEASSSPSLAILRSLRHPHGCDQCPVRFKTHAELHAHKLCRHTPGSSPPKRDRYKCSFCDKSFPFSFSLRMHLRTHTGERPYACQHCHKTFNLQKSFQYHVMAMHTKDFKLHCLLCGKGCVNNTKLKQHLTKSHKA